MTEQPIETEQQFLGNAPTTTGAPTVLELLEDAQAKGEALAKSRQAYLPAGHRISPVLEATLRMDIAEAQVEKLKDEADRRVALAAPLWSPADNVELAALVRKCASASKLLAIAKDQAVGAETALQLALAVEDEAAEAVLEAEQALIIYARKDTGL